MSMASSNTPPVPPVPDDSPTDTVSVRRHHTISTSSRAARAPRDNTISEENAESWNDDEIVGEDWVGGVGAVGEKTSLHRQASLPTRYHRAFQNQASHGAAGMVPPVPGLTSISGNDAEEEEWKQEIAAYNMQQEGAPDAGNDPPLSPYGGQQANIPSPPPADSGVRRHVSLTYGAQSGARKVSSGLKRSGTLQTPSLHGSVQPSEVPPPVEAQEDEYDEYEDPGNYDDEYFTRQGQQQGPYGGPASPPAVGASSPWSTGNEWRTPGGGNSGFSSGNGVAQNNFTIDDVQRALSNMELNSYGGAGGYQVGGQSAHPPRFNPTHPPPNQAPGMMRGNNGRFQQQGQHQQQQQQQPEFDGRKTPLSQQHTGGSLHQRRSNPNLQYQQGGHSKNASGSSGSSGIPNVPPIPQHYLQQQGQGGQQPRLGVTTSFNQNQQQQLQQQGPSGQTPIQGFVNTPIDVPSLIATKGYNPPTFDIRPPFARFFVIKSYTEDDVHKSLKYEIWSSTDPGNKRLDKAFKECAGRGPIYLFFSVNASGHFCGMAEMLTQVDYTRSSTVWASDKWKGVFKVRWIFVRDIPNTILRHIKLNNTQERKPVTNSRDTQELLPEAGQEMLRIFSTHPAKTSLLQDFGFYELQAMQKMQNQSGASSPQLNASAMASPQLNNMSAIGLGSSQQQQQQGAGGGGGQQDHLQQNLFNNNPMAFQSPMMTPMMQMQLQMGLGGIGSGLGAGMGSPGMGAGMGGAQGLPSGMGSPSFGLPQTSQMHQSVMRNSTSPALGGQQQSQQSQSPPPGGGQQYLF